MKDENGHCDRCGYIGDECICGDREKEINEAVKLLEGLEEKTFGVISGGVNVSKSLGVVLKLLKKEQ